MLAREEPAGLKLFDLLVDERGTRRTDEALADRRPRLERFAARYLESGSSVALSRVTLEPRDRPALAGRGGSGHRRRGGEASTCHISRAIATA